MRGKEDNKDQEERENEDGYETWMVDKKGNAKNDDGEEKLKELSEWEVGRTIKTRKRWQMRMGKRRGGKSEEEMRRMMTVNGVNER